MHFNGLSREVLDAFIRDGMNKARRLGLSTEKVSDLCAHHDLPLNVTRATLQKFVTGEIDHVNDDCAISLYQFFTTRDIGRAIISFEGSDPHPYRLLISSLLKSALVNPPAEVTGFYYGYHPSLSKSGYAVRAFQIQREADGLIWFEDYLSVGVEPDEPPEIFHNKGLVIFVAEKPQFISIDLKTGRNMRFFIPSDLYIRDDVVAEMTGPMTSWTRTNKPANRYQRLVRTTERDYSSLQKQTCRQELKALPVKHQKQCERLAEIEAKAVSEVDQSIRRGENGSKDAGK